MMHTASAVGRVVTVAVTHSNPYGFDPSVPKITTSILLHGVLNTNCLAQSGFPFWALMARRRRAPDPITMNIIPIAKKATHDVEDSRIRRTIDITIKAIPITNIPFP
jgi:hypothetical protein